MEHIFIPSYKRADNLKTVKYFNAIGWEMGKIHVVIDSEADDKDDYQKTCDKYGCLLHVVDTEEARRRYDFVYNRSNDARTAALFRNMFYDLAEDLNIPFYIVIDDDTNNYQYRPYGIYKRMATLNDLLIVFDEVKDMMVKRHIGYFGLSQTGDMISGREERLIRLKVMNTTFVNTKYVYRPKRGIMDEDTSCFVTVMNEGYFIASMASGVVLQQTPSAKAKGGLTDVYKSEKLFKKAILTPIQFPSAIKAEKQIMNGNRLHHRVNYKYLMPKIVRGERNNIAWDTYEEDVKFTNEPKRCGRI